MRPFGFAAVLSTRESRGQLARCVRNAAIAGSVRPARTADQGRRCGWPPAPADRRPRSWPPRRTRPRRHHVPSPAEHLRLAGGRQPKPGSAATGAVKGLDRAGVERQQQIAGLNVGVARDGGRARQGKAVAVCQHDGSSPIYRKSQARIDVYVNVNYDTPTMSVAAPSGRFNGHSFQHRATRSAYIASPNSPASSRSRRAPFASTRTRA